MKSFQTKVGENCSGRDLNSHPPHYQYDALTIAPPELPYRTIMLGKHISLTATVVYGSKRAFVRDAVRDRETLQISRAQNFFLPLQLSRAEFVFPSYIDVLSEAKIRKRCSLRLPIDSVLRQKPKASHFVILFLLPHATSSQGSKLMTFKNE